MSETALNEGKALSVSSGKQSHGTPRRVAAAIAALVVAAAVLAVLPVQPPASAEHGGQGFEPGYEIIRTLAGTGEYGFGGDGGPATEARLRNPSDVAVDSDGNTYIADSGNHRVRRVAPNGKISTLAGTGERGSSGDGGVADDAQLSQPRALAVHAGNLYIAEGDAPGDELGNRVRKVDLSSGTITTVAGTGEDVYGSPGDGGPATEAPISDLDGLAVDDAGNLYIADDVSRRVRKVDTEGIITTVAGGGDSADGWGDGNPASDVELQSAKDVAVDAAGNFYIAEGRNRSAVRKVDTEGIITTVAGTEGGFSGDGGPATEARLFWPQAVAVENGNLYIADSRNRRVRKVDGEGIITTVAGTGEQGFSGDDGPPTEANIGYLQGLTAHDDLGLFLASEENERVRQVVRVPDLLEVTTIASDPFQVAKEPTYTVEVANNHTGPATGIALTDELPDEVDFVAAEPTQGSCDQAAGMVTCQLGELASGGHATVEITVAPRAAGEVVENTATVEANDDDPFPPNNNDTVYTPVGDTGCGRVVTEDTTMDDDLGPCPHDGLVVDGDNLTVDLGGHRVLGFHEFSDADIEAYDFLETGTEAGIRLIDQAGVTVEKGTISGFSAGVVINGGSGNTVQGMTVQDNVGPDDAFNAELGDGIFVWNSPGNTIAGNEVLGSGRFDGIGILGPESDGNEVTGNIVEDTLGPTDGGPAGQGIIVNGATATGGDPTTISETRVANNTIRGSGSGGIANINHVGGMIVNNVVEANGFDNANGNGIGLQMGLAAQELDDTSTNVHVTGNEVRGNSWSGIIIHSDDNRVMNNTSTGNGRFLDGAYAGVFFFDLEDNPSEYLGNHTDCQNNKWNNNRWGSAGYAPDCTSSRGLGEGKNPADPGSPDNAPQGLSNATVDDLPQRGPPSEPGK